MSALAIAPMPPPHLLSTGYPDDPHQLRPVPGTHGRVEADAAGVLYEDGEPLTTARQANGYRRVWLPHRGETYVHIAICETWHGPAEDDGMQVDHRNRDRTDNSAVNLAWVHPSENLERRILRRGALHPNATLAERDVALMKAIRRETNASYRALGRAWGVSKDTAWRACTGRTYTPHRS